MDRSSCLSVYSQPTNLSRWEIVTPIRLAEKRIYRDCRTGAPFDSNDARVSTIDKGQDPESQLRQLRARRERANQAPLDAARHPADD